MPRKSRLQVTMEKYKSLVQQAILSGNYIDAVNTIKCLPPRNEVRQALQQSPINITNRQFRVILVEDLDDYKVFIQVPGEKTDYDFFVWRAIFEDHTLRDLKIPSHDDLGRMYLNLKKKSKNIEEHLLSATIRFIRDRMCMEDLINRYFHKEPPDTIKEIKRFFSTLKWIALQEDVNYPPPNLGSLYTLSVYALLEIFGDLTPLRKVIRFKR